MFFIKPPTAVGMAAALACAAAFGQQPPAPSATEASDSTVYRSAFEGYQRFSDEKVQPWRDSNDTVGKIGGWRAYAKEVQDSKALAAPASAGTTKPADPHAGHHKP